MLQHDLDAEKEVQQCCGFTGSCSIALLFFVSGLLLCGGLRAESPKKQVICIKRQCYLVELCDGTGLRLPTLSQVRDEVSRIYSKAGIEIIWLRCGSCCSFPAGPHEARVYIRDRLPEEFRKDETVLGCNLAEFELPPGPLVYVSRSSIEGFIGHPKSYLPEELIRALGRTIAHELAHRFLMEKDHCGSGILRAGFSRDELTQPLSGNFYFTEEQTRFLQNSGPSRGRYTVTIWETGRREVEIGDERLGFELR